MRYVVLVVAVVFVLVLGALTALDFKNNGVSVVGVLGLCVVIICGVGVIGAALHPPRK